MDDIGRAVHKKRHDLCVKQITVADGILLNNAFVVCIIADITENLFQSAYDRLICLGLHDGCLGLLL